MTLPTDIRIRIDKLFPTASDKQEVERLLLSLWTMYLNVGAEQLARCILVLSDGQVTEIKNIFNSNFFGDPRDVIMCAESKEGNRGNYFIEPFPDTPE